MSRRILVIGLDGFETTIADKMIAQGRMPNFCRMLSASACVDLDHGAARRTGLAWEHFSTGLDPSSAHRWSAVSFNPRKYRCTQEPTRLEPFPSKFDFKTVAFDTPYFDLKRAGNVRGIANWGAHDPGTPQDAGADALAREISERFGEYPAKNWIYGFTWPCVEMTREMGGDLVRATHKRLDIAEWLLGERFPDWDLGLVVVSELHSAIEALWHGVDGSHPLAGVPSAQPAGCALEAVYEAVDGFIGSLVSRFPDAVHLALSMHGMGPNHSDVPAMVLLPEILYRRSFGRKMMDFGGDPTAELCVSPVSGWSESIWESWSGSTGFGDRSAGATTLEKLRLALERRLRKLLAIPAPDTIRWMPASWYSPFWPKMGAFAIPAFYDGQVRINVKGRERNGLIDPSMYDEVCNELVSDLHTWTDPATGVSAIEEVHFTHPGDPMSVSETEADIVIVWRGTPTELVGPAGERVGPVATRRTGAHTGGNGISVWHGRDFMPGRYSAHSSFDVVPTLLEYLTGSCSEKVDGTSFMREILR